MINRANELLERFMRYAAVTTQSEAGAKTVPSTAGQRVLAQMLAEELKALGLSDVEVSEYAVVTGRLPSNLPAGTQAPKVGWCAHLDTVDAGLSPDIHPQVVKNYQGGDICLNAEKNLWLRVAEHPEAERYVGDDLILSDGTSVLGADNKSAIANIMTALHIIVEEGRPHGDIYVAFVPDEEIGLCGAKKIDFSKFPVDFAYTIDSCELGEIVWQTFNAGSAWVDIQGITAHPMSSKGQLLNPILVAHDFIGMLDRGQTPEFTEKTEGFVWVNGIQGGPAKCRVSLKIRDHSLKRYEEKKTLIRAIVDCLRVRYPRAKINLTIEDVYGNIADAIKPENGACIDMLRRAMEIEQVTAKDIAMRGGTDGSFISTQGIPTPNYFTGAHNFHSACEFMPMSSWLKSLAVTLRLVELAAGVTK